MRINNNISALNTHRQMSVNTNNATKSMEKLSSGLRINRAGDDAAGLSISEKMRSQIRGLNQATSNAQDGISLIQTAEGALTEVSSMLTRVKELAVQKENGTYNTDDTANIKAEISALAAEINNIVTTTKFNGKDVFNEVTGFSIAIGHDGKSTLIVAKAEIDKLTNGTDAAIKDDITITEVDAAIVQVNTQRATYGSQQNRLEHTINNLGTTSENLTAAESRIRDTDMAKEMSEMTKNNVLTQAAQAMLAQANQQPQSVLQLLQ